MKTRQNPLSKFEAFMQRIVEGPFAFLFPSKLQPAEVTRKLERALEDNSLLQGEGRRLAPDIYDIYLSIKDHQQMTPIEGTLKRDWQEHLVQFARQRHYTLRTDPLFRLHAKRDLRSGTLRIETQLRDRGSGGEDGALATQAISGEQLAQLRQQLLPGQQLPGIDRVGAGAPSGGIAGALPTQYAQAGQMPTAPPVIQQPSVVLPQAWLTIRAPQIQQKVYRIEKAVVNIGRQLTNDIIVEDKRVSRDHAQIKYQADGQFTIFDLGSTNGITVNGVPHLRQHLLRNGDRFTIGSYDFYYERR
ncbi:MAG: FhaA domain-containing protein [Ktedonobacteraceae bacterium]